VIALFVFGLALGYAVWPKYGFIISLSWVILMLVVGSIMFFRGYYDRWKTIDAPWDIQSYSSRDMAVPLLEAFVIKEIIMSSVVSVFEAITLLLVKKKINSLDQKNVHLIISVLSHSAQNGKRFVPITDLHGYDNEIGPLLKAKILWDKFEKGTLYIGVNRKYENASNSALMPTACL
jgi:hypothetical protein